MNTTMTRQGLLGACLTAACLMAQTLTGGPAAAAPGGAPGPGNPQAQSASSKGENHCYSSDGIDVNVLLGVTEAVAFPGCPSLRPGQAFVPLGVWAMASSYETSPGYDTAGRTPAEDFLAKLGSVRFDIDPGTRQARTYEFDGHEIVRLLSDEQWEPSNATGLVGAFFRPVLHPLPVGEHRYEFTIEMSGRHCDGLGLGTLNCLNPGPTTFAGCGDLTVAAKV